MYVHYKLGLLYRIYQFFSTGGPCTLGEIPKFSIGGNRYNRNSTPHLTTAPSPPLSTSLAPLQHLFSISSASLQHLFSISLASPQYLPSTSSAHPQYPFSTLSAHPQHPQYLLSKPPVNPEMPPHHLPRTKYRTISPRSPYWISLSTETAPRACVWKFSLTATVSHMKTGKAGKIGGIATCGLTESRFTTKDKRSHRAFCPSTFCPLTF